MKNRIYMSLPKDLFKNVSVSWDIIKEIMLEEEPGGAVGEYNLITQIENNSIKVQVAHQFHGMSFLKIKRGRDGSVNFKVKGDNPSVGYLFSLELIKESLERHNESSKNVGIYYYDKIEELKKLEKDNADLKNQNRGLKESLDELMDKKSGHVVADLEIDYTNPDEFAKRFEWVDQYFVAQGVSVSTMCLIEKESGFEVYDGYNQMLYFLPSGFATEQELMECIYKNPPY